MKLKDFIKDAQKLKKSWQNLEIKVVAQNGMEFEPKIRAVVDENYDVTHLRVTTD